MSVIFDPAQASVLALYAVFNVIQIVVMFNLLFYAVFDGFHVLAVNKTFERVVRKRDKFFKGVAPEHTDKRFVCVNYFLFSVGVVNQKPAGEFVNKVFDTAGGGVYTAVGNGNPVTVV